MGDDIDTLLATVTGIEVEVEGLRDRLESQLKYLNELNEIILKIQNDNQRLSSIANRFRSDLRTVAIEGDIRPLVDYTDFSPEEDPDGRRALAWIAANIANRTALLLESTAAAPSPVVESASWGPQSSARRLTDISVVSDSGELPTPRVPSGKAERLKEKIEEVKLILEGHRAGRIRN